MGITREKRWREFWRRTQRNVIVLYFFSPGKKWSSISVLVWVLGLLQNLHPITEYIPCATAVGVQRVGCCVGRRRRPDTVTVTPGWVWSEGTPLRLTIRDRSVALASTEYSNLRESDWPRGVRIFKITMDPRAPPLHQLGPDALVVILRPDWSSSGATLTYYEV